MPLPPHRGLAGWRHRRRRLRSPNRPILRRSIAVLGFRRRCRPRPRRFPAPQRGEDGGFDVVKLSLPDTWRVEYAFTTRWHPAYPAVTLRTFRKQVTGVWTAQSKGCGYGDQGQFTALMADMKSGDKKLTDASRAEVERGKQSLSPLAPNRSECEQEPRMLRASVVVFPGSNCDRDVKVALERVTGFPVKMVWHGDASVPASDLIVLPGGFSYGDYLRCGAMAAHSPIMRDVIAKAKAGTPVLGICNGFQVLCESGLLPGVLMRNASLKFICRDVTLRVDNDKTFFTKCYRKDQVVRLPIAHAEGNYFADEETLDRLEGEGRVVFRYCDEAGEATPQANPNGAQRNIAGICDATGRIVGLMPHPERLFELALGGADGRRMIESALLSALEPTA